MAEKIQFDELSYACETGFCGTINGAEIRGSCHPVSGGWYGTVSAIKGAVSGIRVHTEVFFTTPTEV